MKRFGIGAVAWLGLGLILGSGYGILSYKYGFFPVPQIRWLSERLFDDGVSRIGFRDIDGKVAVDCPAPGAMVLLALGQSNAANHGETRFAPERGVYNFNFFDGRCYLAADPLLGATGRGGSVWSRLGALLASRHRDRPVVIAPVGVNGSSIDRWAPGGDLHPRIEKAVRGLAARGLQPTHLLWHQGEADSMRGTTGAVYQAHFARLLSAVRRLGVSAPVFVAVATICHGPGSPAIRAAQRAIIERHPGVRPGADSDRLDRMSMRYDGCHFSDEGLRRHAALWFEALTAP